MNNGTFVPESEKVMTLLLSIRNTYRIENKTANNVRNLGSEVKA